MNYEVEQQTTNLEISKRLKELGVEQKSLWYWVEAEDKTSRNVLPYDWEIPTYKVRWTLRNEAMSPTGWQNVYSAYTVAELGELLPVLTTSGKTMQKGKVHESELDFNCCYAPLSKSFQAGTEADARGLMLRYLREHKLMI